MAKKCVVCGKLLTEKDLETAIPYKNRMAHKSCFNNAVKMVAQDKREQLDAKQKEVKEKTKEKKRAASRPKAELKQDEVSDEEYLEKRDFYQYVKQLKGIGEKEKLPPKIYVLCEKFHNDYEMEWQLMKYTLEYLKNIKEKELTGDIVGIIPYYYSEACDYQKDIKEIEEKSKMFDTGKMYKTRKIIYKKRPERVLEDLVIESIKPSEEKHD